MGKVEVFEVQLDGSSAFSPGQTLHGFVILHVSQTLQIKEIYLRATGSTHTHWVNKTSDKIYESFEYYFNEKIALPLLDVCSDDETMPEGKHRLPFAFTLPDNLPSTVEGHYGRTAYAITACIDTLHPAGCIMPGYSQEAYKSDRAIPVVAHVPSGLYGAALAHTPVEREEVIEMVGCVGLQGSVSIRLALPRSEFKVGSPIEVSVSIGNHSKRGLPSFSLDLLQNTSFRALSRYETVQDSKLVSRSVDSLTLGPILAHKTQQWPLSLDTAQLLPTQVGQLISIQYFLRLRASKKSTQELSIPIVLVSQ